MHQSELEPEILENQNQMKDFHKFVERAVIIDGTLVIGHKFNLYQQNAKETVESIGLNYEMIRNQQYQINEIEGDKLFQISYKNAADLVYSYCGHVQNTNLLFVLIDMAYSLGPNLYDFKLLKKAILQNNYFEMAIEIIDSCYFVQLRERSLTNTLKILRECQNNKLADELKQLILKKLFYQNYGAIDRKYLKSIKNQEFSLIQEQKNSLIEQNQNNQENDNIFQFLENKFANFLLSEQIKKLIFEESKLFENQDVLFSIKYKNWQWLAQRYLEQTNDKLPTMRVIFEGICQALESANIKEYEYVFKKDESFPKISTYKTIIIQSDVTDDLFDFDFSLELTQPESIFVKAILKMYTYQTFIPYELNKACYRQSEASINTLGPFAAVLNEILFRRKGNRTDNQNENNIVLFRSVKYYQSQIDFFRKSFEENQHVQLNGIQQASFNKQTALNHAYNIQQQSQNDNLKTVLFKIEIQQDKQQSYFKLEEQYSITQTGQEEVLIREGLIFKITNFDNSDPQYVSICVQEISY